jgi:hypothetical protein
MIEQTLLNGLELFLSGLTLTPAPKLVGVIEPVAAQELPALVVSIDESRRLGAGLGERAVLITDGALSWKADIDLANPTLPGDPPFPLTSGDRTQLILPHGGLVRSDGTTGALRAQDIEVRVRGVLRTLTSGPPQGGEFSADPVSGTLSFGDPLPADGLLEATYFLGQWEQRVARSHGVLSLALLAADATTVRDLSNTILSALDGSGATPLRGLSEFSVAEVGSIGISGAPLVTARKRVIRFRFQFEEELNIPESSGGTIRRIPVQANVE